MRELAEIEKSIEEVLIKLRPYLEEDGGGVEFVRFEAETNTCEVRPLGACLDCPLWIMTLRAGLERFLLKEVPEIRRIETVK